MNRALSSILVAVLIAALIPSRIASARPAAESVLLTVRPSTPVGWKLGFDNGIGATPTPSQAWYVFGPGTPPIGDGSIRMTVTNNISDTVAVRQMFGTRISDLTKVTYATQLTTLPAFPVMLQFTIDLTMTDAITDDNGAIVFDPLDQNIPILTGQWQEWDAFSGKWYGTDGPLAALCPQSTPCPLDTMIAAFPDLGFHPVNGATILKARRSSIIHTTYVDDLIVGVNGDNLIFDFEPEVPCLTTCWVDAVNGNDLFGGTTPSASKRSIQAAIDAVGPLGTVKVRPGQYHEVAANRTLYNGNGPHTFGLFVPAAKTGIKIIGVDASNAAILSAQSVTTTITTSATNTFGPSGAYIEADGVTISGLGFGPNDGTSNRTIDIVGDNTLLKDNVIEDPNGRVYVNDPRYNPSTGVAHVSAYKFEGNHFLNNSSLEFGNGAGMSGPINGRVVIANTFVMSSTSKASIAIHGAEPGSTEHVYSTGGMVIYGNTMRNKTEGDGLHLIVHGDYNNGQLDWRSFWRDNDFNRAVIAGPELFDRIRVYTGTVGTAALTKIRSINTSIQVQHDRADAGDTVLVSKGEFRENLIFDRPLLIRGAGMGECARTRGSLESVIRFADPARALVDVRTDELTFDGFTLQANGSSAPWMVTAEAPAGLRMRKLRVLNTRFNANPNAQPGGVLLKNQDDALIECNYFNDLGAEAVRVEAASSDEAGSNNLVYRNNDSFSNAGGNLNTVNGRHNNLWVRDNRAVEDSTSLRGLNGAIVIGNRYTGGLDFGSGLILRGGNDTVTVTQNTFTGMRSAGITAFDDGFGMGANHALTITENTVSAVASAFADDAALIDLRDSLGTTLVQSNALRFTGSTTETVHAINLAGELESTEVLSNLITGGQADTTAVTPSSGVMLRGSIVAGARVSVTHNIIAGFVQGVHGDALLSGVDVRINRNDLELNSAYAIFNAGSRMINGECNWYGNGRGPSREPTSGTSGTGTAVAGNVSVAPWLTSPDLSMQCKSPKLTIIQVISGTPRALTGAWQFTTPTGALSLPSSGGVVTVTVAAVGQHTIVQQAQLGYVTTSSCSNGVVGNERVVTTLETADITCTFISRAAFRHLVMLPLAART
jgi:hypothetical protein